MDSGMVDSSAKLLEVRARIADWASEIANIPNMGSPDDGDEVACRVAGEMIKFVEKGDAPRQAGPGGRQISEGETYRFTRPIMAFCEGDATTAIIESDGRDHVFRIERRAGKTHFVKTVMVHRFEPDAFDDALRHYEHAESLMIASRNDAEPTPFVEAPPSDGAPKTGAKCPACGSADVVADCTATWSNETANWEVSMIEGDLACSDCGEEFPEPRS